MKARLFSTLALAACLPAPCATFAADGVNCSIYGQAHVSFELLNDGDSSSLYLAGNGSHIGFRGNMDLDFGLKCIWQLESQAQFDESGKVLASRNSFAGVSGGFGTVLFGRHDSPFKKLGRSADLFGYKLGDSRNIIGLSGYGCDLRLDNVVLYKSPPFHGFSAIGAYSTEDGANDSDVISAGLTYKTGNLTLGAAYEDHGTALTPVDTDADGKADCPAKDGENGLRLAACYKRGKFEVVSLFERLDNIAGVSGAGRNSRGGGVSYAVTEKDVVKAQFFSTDGVSGTAGSGAELFVAGYDRKLSDKTTAYVACAMTRNDISRACPIAAYQLHFQRCFLE
jgi:predicted porin